MRPTSMKTQWLAIGILAAFVPVLIWAFSFFSEDMVKSGPVERTAEGGLLPIQHWELDQGTRVYFVQSNNLPMVDINVSFDAGSARDPLPGTAYLTNAMLRKGAGDDDADSFVERLESIGAQLSLSVDVDRAQINLRTLSDDDALETASTLVGAMLNAPRFSTKDFEQVRSRVLIDLEKEQERPDRLIHRAFMETLYGEHPYAHAVNGSIDAVQEIERKDIQHFFEQYYVPANMVVTVVGDVKASDVDQWVRDWVLGQAAGEKPRPLPQVAQRRQAQRVHLPFESEQTHIRLGQPVERFDDPDAFALTVGTSILGGGMSSRLFQSIRNEHGLAYSVYANSGQYSLPGPYSLVLQTRTEAGEQALELLEQALADFIANGPTTTEVQEAISKLRGYFILAFASNGSIMAHLSAMAFYDMPLDYFDRYLENLEAVTPDSIKEAFTRRVDPQAMLVMTLGKA